MWATVSQIWISWRRFLIKILWSSASAVIFSPNDLSSQILISLNFSISRLKTWMHFHDHFWHFCPSGIWQPRLLPRPISITFLFTIQSCHSDSLLLYEHLLSSVSEQFSHDLERMSPYLFCYSHFGFLLHMKHEADGHSYINHRNPNFFSKMWTQTQQPQLSCKW